MIIYLTSLTRCYASSNFVDIEKALRNPAEQRPLYRTVSQKTFSYLKLCSVSLSQTSCFRYTSGLFWRSFRQKKIALGTYCRERTSRRISKCRRKLLTFPLAVLRTQKRRTADDDLELFFFYLHIFKIDSVESLARTSSAHALPRTCPCSYQLHGQWNAASFLRIFIIVVSLCFDVSKAEIILLLFVVTRFQYTV